MAPTVRHRLPWPKCVIAQNVAFDAGDAGRHHLISQIRQPGQWWTIRRSIRIPSAGECRVTAPHEAQASDHPTLRRGLFRSHNAGGKSRIRTQLGQRERSGEELGYRGGRKEAVSTSAMENLAIGQLLDGDAPLATVAGKDQIDLGLKVVSRLQRIHGQDKQSQHASSIFAPKRGLS